MSRSNFDAIVIGAGITGLGVAQVLSKKFDHVALIESSKVIDEMRTVPQGYHGHNLLRSGFNVLTDLFPGWHELLEEKGCPVVDWGNILFYGPFGWSHREESEFKTYGCSRTLLEYSIRQQLLKNSGITLLDETKVSSIIRDGNSVRGVVVSRGEQETTLSSNIVIDTSGRRSRWAQWLGCAEQLEKTVVDPKVTYVSSIVTLSDTPTWDMCFLTAMPPGNNRAGMLMKIENDQWIITLMGYDGEQPPRNEQEFVDFSKGLRSSEIYEALKGAEFHTPLRAFADTANRKYDLDSVTNWPSGFLTIGDSAMALNPAYGQGMSVALLQVKELEKQLNTKPRNQVSFGRELNKKIVAAASAAWTAATALDRRFDVRPFKKRKKTGLQKIMKSFEKGIRLGIIAGSTKSPILRDEYFSNMHLTKKKNEGISPGVILDILKHKESRSHLLKEIF